MSRRSTVSTEKMSRDADEEFGELATEAETGCGSAAGVRARELEKDLV